MSQIMAKQQKITFCCWVLTICKSLNASRAQVISEIQNKSKDLISWPVAAWAWASTSNELKVIIVNGFNLQDPEAGSSGDAISSLDTRGFCFRVLLHHTPNTTAEAAHERDLYKTEFEDKVRPKAAPWLQSTLTVLVVR